MADDFGSFMDRKATDFFVKVLQKVPENKHHLKLFSDLLQKGDTDVKKHYQKFNDSEKFRFFQNKSEFFCISAGYISLRPFLKKDSCASQKCAKTEMESFANAQCSYSLLPNEVDLDLELVNAFSAEKSAEVEQVIQCFVQYLFDYGETHYINLIIWLERSNLDIKDFFAHATELDKFRFFTDHSEYFIMAPDGFISLLSHDSSDFKHKTVAEKAVELLVLHLAAFKEMHYVKLIKHCEEASSEMKDYFSEFSPAGKYNFFKDRSDLFSIQSNGYVSVISCSSRPQNVHATIVPTVHMHESTEEQVKAFLICRLKSSGLLYFTDLVDSLQQSSLKIKDFFSGFKMFDILTFFKQHSEFSIDDDGFISLSVGREGYLSDGENLDPKSAEDKSIDLLAQCLKCKGKVHYEKLIKFVEQASPKLKTVFANFSASERYMFFKTHPEVFTIENDGFVSLALETCSLPSAVSSEQSASTLAIIEEFTIRHLQKSSSFQSEDIIDYLNVSNPNILNAFGNDLSHGINCFFKENYHFQTSEGGVVTLALEFENSSSEKPHTKNIDVSKNSLKVVEVLLQFLLFTLKDAEAVHYETLINVANEISAIASDFFALFSALGRYRFIQDHPLCLRNDNSIGLFVPDSCDDNSEADTNADFSFILSKVKQYLLDFLKTSGITSCETLIETLEHNANIKDVLDDKLSDILHFLKECTTEFYLDNKGYILITKEKPKSHSNRNKSQMNAIEENVVQFMVLNLEKLGPVHCEKLAKYLKESPLDIKDFFTGYSPAYIEFFFKKYKNKFSVQDDGFVSLAPTMDSASNIQMAYEQTSSAINEADSVVEAITEFLWDVGETEYEDIVSHLSNTCPAVKHYFASVSPFEVFRFFKERPMFHVKSSKYVVLATEVVNSMSSRSSSMPCLDYQSKMNKVVKFFTFHLKVKGAMPYKNLIKLLSNSYSDMCDFFVGCSALGKIDFFKSLPEVFVIDALNIVYLAKSRKDSKVQSVSEIKVDNEQKVIDTMRNHLIENPSVHFEKLCVISDFTLLFFRKFSTSEKFKFFKERSEHFKIEGDGYVCLPAISKVATKAKDIKQSREKVANLPKDTVKILEKAFINAINVKTQSNKKKMTYKALRPVSIAFYENLRTVLEELSHDDIYHFLKARPQYFSWESDHHVSLSAEVLNSQITHIKKKSKSKIQLDPTSMTSSSCCVTNLASRPSVNVGKHTDTCHVQITEENHAASGCGKINARVTVSKHITATSLLSKKCLDVPKAIDTEAFSGGKKSLDTKTNVNDNGINTNAIEDDANLEEIDCRRSSSCEDVKSCDSFTTNSSVHSVSQYSGSKSQSSLRSEPSSSSLYMLHENALGMENDKIKKCNEMQLKGNIICDSNQSESEFTKAFSSDASSINSYNESHIPESALMMDCKHTLPDTVQNKVIDYFVNLLISQGSGSNIHYQQLASYIHNSPEDIKHAFDNCVPGDALHFFSKGEQFSVDSDGNVSISPEWEEIHNAENEIVNYFRNRICHSLQPFHYETLFSAIQNSEIYKKSNVSNVFSSYMPDKCKSFFEKYCDSFSVDSNGFVALCPESKLKKQISIRLSESHKEKKNYVSKSDEDLLSASDEHKREKETKSHFIFRLTDMHVTAVQYAIDTLKQKKYLHFEELLAAVCDSDHYMSVFFSYFTITDVLRFFRIHSLYFFCDRKGIITLKDATVLASKALTSQREIMEVVQKIESEAVKFYVCRLKDKTKANIFQLECFLGSAPGYVISHFSANYSDTDFLNFFLNYSEYFDVSDKCVALTLKAFNEKFVSLINTEECSSPEVARSAHRQDSIIEDHTTDQIKTIGSTKYFEVGTSVNQKIHHSDCLTNEPLFASSAEDSFLESVGESHNIISRSRRKAPEIFSMSMADDSSVQKNVCFSREENSNIHSQDNSRNFTTSPKKINYHNNSCRLFVDSSMNHVGSMPCGASHSPTTSKHEFKPLEKDTSQSIITALCNISTEIKLMKQVLNSAVTCPQTLSFETHNSTQEKSVSTSKLQVVPSFFNVEMERKCVDFYSKILQSERFPVSVSSLQLCTLKATSDMKTYLSDFYLSDLSLFFHMHLKYFEIDQYDRVSLRSVECAKSTDSDDVSDKSVGNVKAKTFL